MTVYSYKLQSITIIKDLKMFSNKYSTNFIEFWNYPNNSKWSHHISVNRDIKKFNLIPLSLSKVLWNFEESNNIIKNWYMIFQASNLKDNQFLNLLDDNLYYIELLYIKEGSWIKYFEHTNLLCIRATWAITNYTPIGKYCLRLFPRKSFNCPCGSYSIKTRCYILYNYRRSNKYWNQIRDMLS